MPNHFHFFLTFFLCFFFLSFFLSLFLFSTSLNLKHSTSQALFHNQLFLSPWNRSHSFDWKHFWANFHFIFQYTTLSLINCECMSPVSTVFHSFRCPCFNSGTTKIPFFSHLREQNQNITPLSIFLKKLLFFYSPLDIHLVIVQDW